jgi:glutathione peroxidase
MPSTLSRHWGHHGVAHTAVDIPPPRQILRAMKTLTLLAALLLAPMLHAQALYDIPLKDINGRDTSLKEHKGKVLLIVNVASKCGNTPQYTGLEALYQKHKDKGLVVLGFPCNQFGGQEPGSNADIKEFCTQTYKVNFPLYDKLDVKGKNQHPLYKALSGPDSPFPGDVKWNFGKFLIGKDGKPLARFEPQTKPDSPEVTGAIEQALE